MSRRPPSTTNVWPSTSVQRKSSSSSTVADAERLQPEAGVEPKRQVRDLVNEHRLEDSRRFVLEEFGQPKVSNVRIGRVRMGYLAIPGGLGLRGCWRPEVPGAHDDPVRPDDPPGTLDVEIEARNGPI